MENTYAERRSNDYKATLLGISLIGKVPAKFKKYALWIDRYILRRFPITIVAYPKRRTKLVCGQCTKMTSHYFSGYWVHRCQEDGETRTVSSCDVFPQCETS